MGQSVSASWLSAPLAKELLEELRQFSLQARLKCDESPLALGLCGGAVGRRPAAFGLLAPCLHVRASDTGTKGGIGFRSAAPSHAHTGFRWAVNINDWKPSGGSDGEEFRLLLLCLHCFFAVCENLRGRLQYLPHSGCRC